MRVVSVVLTASITWDMSSVVFAVLHGGQILRWRAALYLCCSCVWPFSPLQARVTKLEGLLEERRQECRRLTVSSLYESSAVGLDV